MMARRPDILERVGRTVLVRLGNDPIDVPHPFVVLLGGFHPLGSQRSTRLMRQ